MVRMWKLSISVYEGIIQIEYKIKEIQIYVATEIKYTKLILP